MAFPTWSSKHLFAAASLIVLIGAIFVGMFVSALHDYEAKTSLYTEIAKQRTTLLALAELIDRNGADETVSKTIIDCSRRSEYEALLIKLDTLTKRELISLQNLFESCGTYYATQKTLMVDRLLHEVAYYEHLIKLLQIFEEKIEPASDLVVWQEIVSREETRSTMLTEQAVLQEKIISALLSGNNPKSGTVQELALQAHELNELMSVHDQQIDVLRKELQQ